MLYMRRQAFFLSRISVVIGKSVNSILYVGGQGRTDFSSHSARQAAVFCSFSLAILGRV